MIKTKYKKLTADTFLFAIGTFGTKILTFLLVPLYTNYLSTDDYGIADLILTTATLLCYVFTLNISEAVLRFAIDNKGALYQQKVLSVANKVIFIGCSILAIILYVFSGLHIIECPNYYYVFIVLLCFIQSMKNTLFNYLRAIDIIKTYVIMSISNSLLFFTFNIFFVVVLKNGLIGYLIANILSELLCVVAIIVKLIISKRFSFRIKYIVCKELAKDMTTYSIPLVFNSMGWWINNSIDRYLVTAYCGTASNGVYAIASKIPSMLTIFQGIFSQAWTLSAIREYDNDDTDSYYATIYSYYTAFSLIGCTILLLFNKWIAKWLFSKEFFEAWHYAPILLFSVIFSGLSANIGSVFIAAKDSKIFSQSTIIGAIVNIILNLLLIPTFQVYGAAWATACSFFVIWLIRLKSVKKYTNAKYFYLKDFVSFILILIQIVLGQGSGLMYYSQIILTLLILVIYNDKIRKMISALIKNMKFMRR